MSICAATVLATAVLIAAGVVFSRQRRGVETHEDRIAFPAPATTAAPIAPASREFAGADQDYKITAAQVDTLNKLSTSLAAVRDSVATDMAKFLASLPDHRLPGRGGGPRARLMPAPTS